VSYTPRGYNQLEIAGEKTVVVLVQKTSKPTRVQENIQTLNIDIIKLKREC
jgi:hypothetical protein